jgi:hypothetical protein
MTWCALTVLAMTAAGCGGNAPETPPEQKSVEAGQAAMDLMKTTQKGTMNLGGATEKTKKKGG